MAALAQSAVVAAISCAPVASGAVATSSSKAQSNFFALNGLKSASNSLQVAQPREWFSKTVSNSTRVECIKVWNPYNNKKFETMSYLPPLSDTRIAKQIQYLISNGWIHTIEFDQAGDTTRTNGSWRTYYDGRLFVHLMLGSVTTF
ncbi:hypothetical protein CBR_g19695 [Chara braunii]|uniref:Ribulose bisphosphate carboxylase small subunit n=1 Tax=Chara braunii TaxID=69332 RepID=A0A388KYX5_CHABU|nr:hypothetical protein CBR_g19695 [Chara braunii]|eukprot:GBG75182.1 hypothetical protein CBR_g19695 [Chara braunii]